MTNNSKSRISAKTLIVQFRTQLKDLIKIIKSTNPHYIRCIKPNDQNISSEFDRKRVNEQIKYSGILAAIKVSRAGYPVRFKFEDFRIFYQIIPECRELKLEDILEKGSYCKGLTKIFLKDSAYELLEYKKERIIKKHVIFIQKNIRRYFKSTEFISILEKITQIQSIIKCYLEFKSYHIKLKRVVLIQKIVRKYFARKNFSKILNYVIIIQKNIKRFLIKRRYYIIIKNILIIQRNIHKYFYNKKLLIQCQNKKDNLKVNKFEKNDIKQDKLKYKLKEEELKKIKLEHSIIIKKCKKLEEDTEIYKKDALRKIKLYEQIAILQEENAKIKYRLNQKFSLKTFITNFTM